MAKILIIEDSSFTRKAIAKMAKAGVQEDSRKQCMELGAVDILNKPPKNNELQIAINKAVKKEEVTL